VDNALRTILILLAVLAFIIPLILWIEYDFKQWRQNKNFSHGKEWRLKGLSLLPSISLFVIAHPGNVFLSIPTVCFLQMALWWFFFDGLYNDRRNFSWWFNGSFNDKGFEDPFSDKLLRRMKVWQQALLKIGLIVLFISIYVVTFKK
jgi:ABC-type Fe3+ transport system permease subunit